MANLAIPDFRVTYPSPLNMIRYDMDLPSGFNFQTSQAFEEGYWFELAAGPRIALGNTTAGTVLTCLLYTSPSPRDRQKSRMPSSA